MEHLTKVYACGSNFHFEAGSRIRSKASTLHEVSFPNAILFGVKSLAAGMNFSALIDKNGILYTWGLLNLQPNTQEPEKSFPEEAMYFSSRSIALKEVSTMNEHAAVVSENGRVFIWGNNLLHHFPNPVSEDDVLIQNPSEIELTAKAVSVACGGYFTMILTENGQVWMCGVNNQDELGLVSDTFPNCQNSPNFQNSQNFRNSPNFRNSVSGLAVVEYPEPIPSESFSGRKIVQIAAGWNHSAALSEEGIVFTWGRSNTGRLGRNALRKIDMVHFDKKCFLPIKHISCGHNDTYAVDEYGRIYGSGWNEGGQHGSGVKKAKRFMKILNGEENIMMCSSGSDHSLMILDNGIIKGAGSNENGKLGLIGHQLSALNFTTILGIGKGTKVACGYSHSLIVTSV